jgi:flagellar motor protein MotB
MFHSNNNDTDFNFWPSIADTLLAIFLVFLMLWLVEKLVFLQELDHVKTGNQILTDKFAKLNQANAQSEEELAQSEEELKNAKQTLDEAKQNAQHAMQGWQTCEGEKKICEQEKATLQVELKNCQRQQSKSQSDASQAERALQQCESDKARYLRDKPPIINLPETLGFSFNSGQALLSEGFENRLKNDIVPKLTDIKNKHNVNVIEVIGHTDGVIAGGSSNLDTKLENAVANRDLSGLRYGSNADLGLMRALAVAFFLRKQPELSGVKFRVYSAAQLILPNGELAESPNRSPADARRRIELRFTNL